MESSFSSTGTDPLLLLKERIIKTETLLDKYACLTRKFIDLEKAHSEAVENEKKAKKDASKYLEKYCKLAKKSNCLLIKIKTLEDNIHAKTNELKENQDEYAKLESVLQVYKTERKGHQCLKKDRDFLLTTLWKVLKRLEEEPKENKSKKITETFFKRFERELMDLKLEDFRYSKVKNNSRLTEKEESEFLFSPGSQILGSVESDFIDTDVAPESVKSSFESDENCVMERIKHISSNQRVVDTEQLNDMKTIEEVNVLANQPLRLPNLSLEPFISQDFEERIDSNFQEKYISEDCVNVHTSENIDFNLFHSTREEGSLSSVSSFSFLTKGHSTSDIVMQQSLQDEGECLQNSLNLTVKCCPEESKDNLREEEKMPEQLRKTYCSPKFKFSSENDEILKKKLFEHCQLANMNGLDNGTNTGLNAIGNIKSADIDVCNVSTETISLDTDVSIEDIGGIPHHVQYCETIYDFLTSSGEMSHQQGRILSDEDSNLLFLTENELDTKPSELHSGVEKTPIRKSTKTVSVFDVEDSGSSTPGCVRDEEPADISLEFNSDIVFSMTDSGKFLNTDREVNEKSDVIEPDEISRKLENENQVDEKPQKNSSPTVKESEINCNSNRILDSTIEKNCPNLEFTEQENYITDEEIYRILKDYKIVPLLSPIKEKEPSKSLKVLARQSSNHDDCNVSQNIKVMSNIINTESHEEMLHHKSDREERAPLCNPNTDMEREKKMVDKSMQTEDKVFLEEHETVRSNGTGGKIVFPEPMMKKLCKMVWKRNLKKFRQLKKIRKICETNSACFDFMKTVLEMINRPRLYFRNRTTENFYLMEKNASHNTSNVKCDERKMASWHVEDIEATNVISKNEPVFNYPKVEDCNFFTQVPVNYYPKVRLNNSAVKSEEMRSQKNKMSLKWFTSEQQIGFATPTRRELPTNGDTRECDVSRECGIDSDIALRYCHSNDAVNDLEKRCESSAETHDSRAHSTRESILESVPVTDVTRYNSDADKTKTDIREKCVVVKETKFRSGEACSKKEENAVLLRRSPRIHSQHTLFTEKEKRTNNHSLKLNESHSLMKVNFFGVSLSSVNGNCTESHETSCNESINDIIQSKEISEEPETSKLKDKFQELFGEPESQFDCSSVESGEDLETTFALAEAQRQASVNLQSNGNGYTSDGTKSKKRRFFCNNSKSGSTNNHKKMKSELTSVDGLKDFEKRFTENEAPLNDTFTFSSQDIKTGNSCNILDSIMTAMTKQTEFFKVQTTFKETEVSVANYRNICSALQSSQPRDCISSDSVQRKISNEYRMKGDNSAFLNVPYFWNVDNNFGKETFKGKNDRNNSEEKHRRGTKLKSLVEKEIRNFVKLDINTVEEGEERIKSVIAVLRKANENIIANAIVNEIMENVDEELKEFERPAPPLTQTQHRIMIILTVFSLSDEQFQSLSSKILKTICSKIFPENFFWPDDSLEMATRFYTALCKKMNNFKGIWKFCFKVITSMRQRWCIPILVVLQVWPDIIHNANEVENNILVKTFVNVILHTPKSEDLRRKRQEKKILAIKHLLINFYNFDMNSTIEGFTQKLWESFVNNAQGSFDALVLMSKCRNWSWTRKNVIAKLLETLESWMNRNSHDVIVSEVLDVLQQITPVFPDCNATEASSVEDVISVLTRVLTSEMSNPTLKEKIIRILCSLCHYSGVREVLVQFSEKLSTSESLYADIQKALSSKNPKCKEGSGKVNKKIAPMKKKKKLKKKKNSSRQSVLDIK